LRALPSQDWYSVIAWISSTEYVRRYGPLVRRFGTALQVQPGTPLAEEALAFERIPNYSHHTHPERASADIATRLRIPVGAEVTRTDYVSRANDELIMLAHSCEPLAITEGTVIERAEEDPYMGAGLIDRFTAIGKRPTTVGRLRARMPRPSETAQLQ
jgi:DNA-binding GntR family transcriptional regulator